MKLTTPLLCIASLAALSACQNPRPVQIGNNKTGAALIATPSTFGATTFTADSSRQYACTEPRPNASLASTLTASGKLEAEQVQAALTGAASSGVNVGASAEFESVEFLAHGLFAICQMAASKSLTPEAAKELSSEIIEKAAAKSKATSSTIANTSSTGSG